MGDQREEALRDQMPEAKRRGPRWWPAVVVVILLAVFMGLIWFTGEQTRQERIMPTIMAGMLAVTLLLFWAVLFSRFRLLTRLGVVMLAGLLAFGALWFLEIKGMSGDFIPIIGWRGGDDTKPTQQVRGANTGDAANSTATQLATLEGAGDWPQFLGPNRYPVVEGVTLATDWQTDPPKEIWRIGIGESWSAFAVSGPFAVTQEQRGDFESVTAYELATGRLLWIHGDAARYGTDPAQGTIAGVGPRATPTIVGDRVYTMGSTGLVNCLDLATGDVLWSHNTLAEFNGVQLMWGLPASPLVVDGRVVVHFDSATGSTLIAFDADTGSEIWRADTRDRAAYGTPMVAELDGVRQVVIFNVHTVAGHDIETGSLLWSADFDPGVYPKVAMPLVVDENRLFVSAGYSGAAAMYRIERGEDGKWIAEEAYRSRRMNAKFANMVMDADHKVVYGIDDGILACVDLETGNRLWKGGRYGHGQLIRVGGLLLITTETTGELVLVEATPAKHNELARFQVFEDKTWNPPALVGRYLLMRNNHEAVCLELPIAD